MKKYAFYLIAFLILTFAIYKALNFFYFGDHPERQWEVQSIDTMKFSRDRAREMALNTKAAEREIDNQMKDIAATGVTHVAIGTPYDEEFVPMMKLWVKSARKYKLNVWYRSNFSGWEGWFGYEKIDKQTHIDKTRAFILEHPDLFEDGDIFTSCTECENGHKLSYGNELEIEAHRQFLLTEYTVAKDAFGTINKDVKANFYSMNGDLAKAMMDMDTTIKFDGIVVIDHYVKDPAKLEEDIRFLAKQSGGTIILGEFGAPIPDIHGTMSEQEQELWVNKALEKVAQIPEVGGVNYWVNKDSSTAIWTMNGKAKAAVNVLSDYFKGNKLIIRYSN